MLAGIATNFILATGTDMVFHAVGVFPPYGQPFFATGPFLLASSYRVIYEIFGGFIIAVVAKEKAEKALWISGTLGAIMWLAGTVAMADLGPLWYGILGAALSIPATLLGGKLYQGRVQRLN